MYFKLEGVEHIFLHQNDFFFLKLPMPSILQDLIHVNGDDIFILRTDEDGNQAKDMKVRFLDLNTLFLLSFKKSVHQ